MILISNSVLGRPCLQSLTSGAPSDSDVMPPLVPVVQILKKNWDNRENVGESWGQHF